MRDDNVADVRTGKFMKRIGSIGVQMALAASLFLGVATVAQATTVITTNPLSRFNAPGRDYADRLTQWFGKGSLTLTSIFDSTVWEQNELIKTNKFGKKLLPATLNDLVAGKGPTFTILYAVANVVGDRQMIGWYNPLNGVTTFGGNAGDTAYDAFIFNFTTGRVLRPAHDAFSQYYSDDEIVSNVRAGTNIYLDDGIPGSGISIQDMYQSPQGSQSILWKSNGRVGENYISFGYEVEVYSISVDSLVAAAAVPEPAIWATMLVGFGLMGGVLRRSRRKNETIFA